MRLPILALLLAPLLGALAPVEMVLECVQHPQNPELVGKRISKRYDVLWCTVQNTSEQSWRLTVPMVANALAKVGVAAVNDDFTRMDFGETTGRAKRVFGALLKVGGVVGGASIKSLGPFGAVLGFLAGEGGAALTDRLIGEADNLGPKLSQIMLGLGPREVVLEAYAFAGLMILVVDRGTSPPIVHATLQIYLEETS